jgi:dUTP pyrophosphatase
MNQIIYFSKVKPDAVIPSKRKEDAGYDIYACFEEDYIIIYPHETKSIPTGIASACSDDYYFQLFERGSTGIKGIGQRSGVIDSGYRKEWFVPITNHNDSYLVIRKENVSNMDIWGQIMPNNVIDYPYEKAICQAVLLLVPKVDVEEVEYETLKSFASERGMGCLGSTNK